MVKNRSTLLSTLTLLSKGRNKTLKRLLLLNKSVASWKSWNLFRGERKLGGWKKTSCRWNWIFPTFTTNWNFDLHSPACPLGLCPWKFQTGWRYNPNSMCLSVLHSFTSQLLTELKNVNMILKQLQETNASKGSNKMNYHVGWTVKWSLQLTFSCYIGSDCGSFISWFF